MIPYPKNKPSEYGKYKVQLQDGSIEFATWNGCGWAKDYIEKNIQLFNPLKSTKNWWKWDKQTKSLIKIEI